MHEAQSCPCCRNPRVLGCKLCILAFIIDHSLCQHQCYHALHCSGFFNLEALKSLCMTCRQMFANAQLARMAAEKELEEAQGRTTAQHALANARAQAAQRALVVAKEKASNEAKSEFMSLMCHEVRSHLLGHNCKRP